MDPIQLERSYYLAPEATATKPYALLRRALVDTDLVAIVRFTLRKRTRLGALRVRDDVLTLQRLLWDDEVRQPDFETNPKDDVNDSEVKMASQLVQSLSGDFTPQDFTDEYAEQLDQLVEAKLEQGDAVNTEATFGEDVDRDSGEVIDLMEALRQSVDRARGGGPAKKTGAKKPTAKKTSAKKTTAKKAGAKKSAGTKKSASRSTGRRAS